jgi:CBS domain-containing protein
MGANVLRFPPPLGFFGTIKVERSGSHKGMFDLKKGGIFAITEGVKILSLETGCLKGGTLQRIQCLVEADVLSPREAQDLEASFNFLVLLRLRGQVEALRKGQVPTNHLALDGLNGQEQGRLRLAMKEVRTFQDMLKRRFRLDLYG